MPDTDNNERSLPVTATCPAGTLHEQRRRTAEEIVEALREAGFECRIVRRARDE
jgi:hypothetical protein